MTIKIEPEEVMTLLMLIKSTAIPNAAYIDIRKDMDDLESKKQAVAKLFDSPIQSIHEEE